MNGVSAEFFKRGHGKIYVRFYTIYAKRGNVGRTLIATFRIMMSTYPMDIPLFSLKPEKIGLLLWDDKVDGIWYKISWGDRYGTAASLQDRKGEEAQPTTLYEPVLGRIEAAVNYDPHNLIVDGMEETYEFILAHQIRESTSLWYRAMMNPGQH